MTLPAEAGTRVRDSRFRAISGGCSTPPDDLAGFPAEHRALAGDAPVIAGDVAGFADHAVARHHERDRVLADRGADSARCRRLFELAGDVRIGNELAHRDFQKRVPDPHFPVGADQDDAQRLLALPLFRIEDAPCNRRCARAVFHIGRARPAAFHVGQCCTLLAVIGEGEAGQAAPGCHHQRAAERRRMKAEVNGQAFAAGFPLAGRHRLVGDEQVVQTARAGQADFVGGVEHARRVAQQLPCAVERQRLQKRLRRQPGPAAEQVMQFGRCDAGGFGDGFDFGLLAPVAADVADRLAHDVIIGSGGSERHRVLRA